MNDLIFVDVETTGLEPEKHEVWEIAFAIDDGAIRTFQLPHNLLTADPKALELNGYVLRQIPSSCIKEDQELMYVREAMRGATIVAANPTFDRMMLRSRWGMEPWHHRSIDIETMAMAILGEDRPLSMKHIADRLRDYKYHIPLPDHSAAGDVAALRASFHALKNFQRKFFSAYYRKPYEDLSSINTNSTSTSVNFKI